MHRDKLQDLSATVEQIICPSIVLSYQHNGYRNIIS